MNARAVLVEVTRLTAERERLQEAEFAEQLRRAEDGDANAMYDVAYALDEGEGVACDERRASVWYAKAAARSHVRAMNNLGFYYQEEGDDVEAMRWYRKAAKAGDALAMRNLGWFYLEGTGTAKDLAAAKLWLERAVDMDHTAAKWPLSLLLREEDPVGNGFRCAQLLREAAEESDEDVRAYRWALCLLNGEGVVADRAAAERWMCTAASLGDEDAQEWLQKHGESWIPEWEWVPKVSLGPLVFGESPDGLADALGLEVDDFRSKYIDYEGEHPESRGLISKLYTLQLSREYGLLCALSTSRETDLIIRYRGVDLLGAALEEALAVLEADDWKVDDLCVGDADVSSESLGISLDVTDQRVNYLYFTTEWESDDEFRVGSDR